MDRIPAYPAYIVPGVVEIRHPKAAAPVDQVEIVVAHSERAPCASASRS
nr:hypothetical protein [Herbidospora sakaeratensis]